MKVSRESYMRGQVCKEALFGLESSILTREQQGESAAVLNLSRNLSG